MIALALLLAAAHQPTAARPAPASDIVVIGERLKTWRGSMRPVGTAIRCVTTRSTGDAEIDQIGCAAMVTCFTPLRPRMEAAADRRRSKAERRALQTAVERELGPCMVQRRDQMIADLAERRYQARQGNLNAAN